MWSIGDICMSKAYKKKWLHFFSLRILTSLTSSKLLFELQGKPPQIPTGTSPELQIAILGKYSTQGSEKQYIETHPLISYTSKTSHKKASIHGTLHSI